MGADRARRHAGGGCVGAADRTATSSPPTGDGSVASYATGHLHDAAAYAVADCSLAEAAALRRTAACRGRAILVVNAGRARSGRLGRAGFRIAQRTQRSHARVDADPARRKRRSSAIADLQTLTSGPRQRLLSATSRMARRGGP